MRRSVAALCTVFTLTLAQSVCADPPNAEPPKERAVNGMYLTGGIITIASGLGLAAAGIYATLAIDAIEEQPQYVRFQEGVPSQFDSCEAARDGTANFHYRFLEGAYLPSEMVAKCDEIDDLTALQVIAFPTSVILAGLGSYLLLEAVGAGYDDLGMRIEPIVAPGYQGAAATVSF